MPVYLKTGLLSGLFILFGAGCVGNTEKPMTIINTSSGQQSSSKFILTSQAFASGAVIPQPYTCHGQDINPPLSWSGAPEGTKSFALIVDDPDAPSGTWVHWTLWNIPATTTGIAQGTVPEDAMQGITSFGATGYGGPCPPSGTHRYFFKLYALDIKRLDLPYSTTANALEAAMQGHILKKSEFMGQYTAR